MPAQRDEPSAPPQAENDTCQRIVVALRATGRLVPAFRRGMSLPYGTGADLFPHPGLVAENHALFTPGTQHSG